VLLDLAIQVTELASYLPIPLALTTRRSLLLLTIGIRPCQPHNPQRF
jgi:hypothetical protein